MRKVCCSIVADFLDWVNSEAKKPPCDQRLCLYDQRQILAYKLQQDRWEGRLTQNSFINNKTPGVLLSSAQTHKQCGYTWVFVCPGSAMHDQRCVCIL